MKALMAELSSEGRYDILERVKAYRGGENTIIITFHIHGIFRLWTTG
jgi:hypothetical protein